MGMCPRPGFCLFDFVGVIVEPWMSKCLRLAKTKRFLTFTEVNDCLPDDQVDPEKLNEFLLLLEAEGLELRADTNPQKTPTPTTHCEMLYYKFAPDLLEG